MIKWTKIFEFDLKGVKCAECGTIIPETEHSNMIIEKDRVFCDFKCHVKWVNKREYLKMFFGEAK